MMAPSRHLVGFFSSGPPGGGGPYVTSGLYESADGAHTWSEAGLPAPFSAPWQLPYGLAFDPVDPQTLYAAGWSGLYRTHDHGATWTLLGETLHYWSAYAVAV